jgi:hypothetical protein
MTIRVQQFNFSSGGNAQLDLNDGTTFLLESYSVPSDNRDETWIYPPAAPGYLARVQPRVGKLGLVVHIPQQASVSAVVAAMHSVRDAFSLQNSYLEIQVGSAVAMRWRTHRTQIRSPFADSDDRAMFRLDKLRMVIDWDFEINVDPIPVGRTDYSLV